MRVKIAYCVKMERGQRSGLQHSQITVLEELLKPYYVCKRITSSPFSSSSSYLKLIRMLVVFLLMLRRLPPLLLLLHSLPLPLLSLWPLLLLMMMMLLLLVLVLVPDSHLAKVDSNQPLQTSLPC